MGIELKTRIEDTCRQFERNFAAGDLARLVSDYYHPDVLIRPSFDPDRTRRPGRQVKANHQRMGARTLRNPPRRRGQMRALAVLQPPRSVSAGRRPGPQGAAVVAAEKVATATPDRRRSREAQGAPQAPRSWHCVRSRRLRIRSPACRRRRWSASEITPMRSYQAPVMADLGPESSRSSRRFHLRLQQCASSWRPARWRRCCFAEMI
jgi:hypothetical protein